MQTTLDCFAAERAGFFSQCMGHHTPLHSSSLIGLAALLFDPQFMTSLWRFTAHVDQVTPSQDIIWCMLDAMHLFRVNQEIIIFILVRK